MKSALFFWGTFLIFTGVLLLLNNFNLLTADFSELVGWWPLLLVIWGAVLLKIPELAKNILMALAGVLSAMIIITFISGGISFVDSFKGNKDFENETTSNCNRSEAVPAKGIKDAKLNFSGGAGKFVVGSTDEYLYKINSGSALCDIDIDNPDDTTIVLNYSFVDNDGGGRYSKIEVYDMLDWDIDISAGASSLILNLNELKVKSLSIDAGASNATIKLSADFPITKVKINCGAATLEIEIPNDAACSVQGDMTLSKTNFAGLSMNSSGVFISDNYYQNVNKIDFYIDGTLSNISIIRR